MTFSITALSLGGAPLEVRCDEGGIETVPTYLAEMIVERVERGDAVSATPAGPAFGPTYEGGDAGVLHLVLEVLRGVADPDTITGWGDVPDWSGIDPSELHFETVPQPSPGVLARGGLRLVVRQQE